MYTQLFDKPPPAYGDVVGAGNGGVQMFAPPPEYSVNPLDEVGMLLERR